MAPEPIDWAAIAADPRFQLLRAGYQGLHQLVCAGWYAMPASQAAVGYPGPPVQWKLAEGAA